MSAQILDGKALSKEILTDAAQQCTKIKKLLFRKPALCIILVGDNLASSTYVKNKMHACDKVGIYSNLISLKKDIREKELVRHIDNLNKDDKIDAIIVQLPLPKHINSDNIILKIHPEKDVDGFHPINYGKMALKLPSLMPATPFGIITLLKKHKIPTRGTNCVIVGRSRIVGAPISIIMSVYADATVTLCHSKTQNLKYYTQNADILIIAIGKAEFITKDMIKKGSVVVDVGINKILDTSHNKGYRLVGDIEYHGVAQKASYITPVPGGVGPMTIASLILNTLRAASIKAKFPFKDWYD